MSGYHGHKTLADGSDVPLSADEAKRICDDIERQEQETQAKLPDEDTTRLALTEAFYRLRDFGWREAIYCPKDGSLFHVIEAGSSGVHTCHYEGEWPKGTWWIHGDGDLWPSRPILWRPIPTETPKGATE